MLDPHGFVATCNSTHFFIVRKGEVWTSTGKYCLGGITRGECARDLPRERHSGVREGFLADRRLWRRRGVRDRHVRGIVPVREVDGRELHHAAGRWSSGCRSSTTSGSRRRGGAAAAVTVRIAMWSGPRNLSTAMMRSFGNRADTFVSDEPFYGCFPQGDRRRSSDARRGDRGDGLRLASVMATLAGPAPDGAPVWYQKHMWHHMVGPIGYDDFAGFTHAFLIREPERMIASYLRKREAPRSRISGWSARPNSSSARRTGSGHAPPVIDADDVLADPEGVLSRCARRWVSRGTRRCSAGRRAGARRTGLGRRIGTARSRKAPASVRRTATRRPPRRCAAPRRPLPALLRASRGLPAEALTVTR